MRDAMGMTPGFFRGVAGGVVVGPSQRALPWPAAPHGGLPYTSVPLGGP